LAHLLGWLGMMQLWMHCRRGSCLLLPAVALCPHQRGPPQAPSKCCQLLPPLHHHQRHQEGRQVSTRHQLPEAANSKTQHNKRHSGRHRQRQGHQAREKGMPDVVQATVCPNTNTLYKQQHCYHCWTPDTRLRRWSEVSGVEELSREGSGNHTVCARLSPQHRAHPGEAPQGSRHLERHLRGTRHTPQCHVGSLQLPECLPGTRLLWGGLLGA
jgi:hypothetical protein